MEQTIPFIIFSTSLSPSTLSGIVIKIYMQIFVSYIHLYHVYWTYMLHMQCMATPAVYVMCACKHMLYFILILPFTHICKKSGQEPNFQI